MLGYLANARKSHDNNPFMRTILDQQARDNKAEYLADADLTRNAQTSDNDYAKQLNLAQLLQKDQSEKASRGSSMFTATDGAVQTDPLTQDQNMNGQDPNSMEAVLEALQLDKMLDPIKKKGEIGKIGAETADTQMATLKKGQEIGNMQVDVGDLDPFSIDNPNIAVTPNPENMSSTRNARIAGDALVESTKQVNTKKGNVPTLVVDGVPTVITDAQVEELRNAGRGKEIRWKEETISEETASKGTTRAAPKVGKVTKDVDGLASYIAANPQLGYVGTGVDEKGAYATTKDGKRVHMKED